MKTINKLQDKYVGKTVEVTEEFVEATECPDTGMRATITNITEETDCFKFTFNFEKHRAFNEKRAQRDFYDENNEPNLTWFESGYYRNGIIDFYLYREELEKVLLPLDEYFTICENNQVESIAPSINGDIEFETWWVSSYEEHFIPALSIAFKEVALKAWNQAKSISNKTG